MPLNTKIATCSYCGTRAALVLTGKTRHELACASCGAPLHELKMMPQAKAEMPTAKSAKHKAKTKLRIVEVPHSRERDTCKAKKKFKRKKKRKKGWTARTLDEVWDVIEDIFD